MRNRQQQGFSLMESVLATAIILVGLVSIISLATVTLIGGQATSDEFEAVNFAREAMELVRNQRDSNWLQFDADGSAEWADGLYEMSGLVYDYTAIATMNPSAATRFEFAPNAFGDTCVGASSVSYDCTAIWYHWSHTRYLQTSDSTFVPADYEQTKFQRLVTLWPICRDATSGVEQILTSADDCSILGKWDHVGIDAIVQVRWPQRGGYRTYTIEEHLYDWKY